MDNKQMYLMTSYMCQELQINVGENKFSLSDIHQVCDPDSEMKIKFVSDESEDGVLEMCKGDNVHKYMREMCIYKIVNKNNTDITEDIPVDPFIQYRNGLVKLYITSTIKGTIKLIFNEKLT